MRTRTRGEIPEAVGDTGGRGHERDGGCLRGVMGASLVTLGHRPHRPQEPYDTRAEQA